jgi:hypothetical protein
MDPIATQIDELVNQISLPVDRYREIEYQMDAILSSLEKQ